MSVSQRLREPFVVFVRGPVWADLVWLDDGFNLNAKPERGWSHGVDIKRILLYDLMVGFSGYTDEAENRHDQRKHH